MKTILLRFLPIVLALSFSLAPLSEARIGGGRSSGYRGSRGFTSPRYSRPAAPPTQPYQQPYQAPPSQSAQGGAFGNGYGGGGFGRGLLGGLAGGMLGSMLFRNSGYGGNGMGGGGGFGLLELLLLAGVAYWVFKRFNSQDQKFTRYQRPETTGFRQEPILTQVRAPAEENSEDSAANVIRAGDPGFDLSKFKEDRMDDFLRLQASWNHRDLTGVSDLLASEMRTQLEKDIADLKALRQINKIENIAVRSSDLVEAWQENGTEFATLHFRANVTDYTVDESSGALVSGNRETPVKFDENWTFSRQAGGGYSGNSWKLTAIEN